MNAFDLNIAWDALERFLDSYLVERDLEKTISMTTPDIYSLGTGTLEVARNQAELRALVEKEVLEDPSPFSYQFRFKEGKLLADGVVSFLCGMRVGKNLDSPDGFSMDTRLTSMFRRCEDGVFRACSLHMSVALAEQEETEFYPYRYGQKTVTEIRQDLQEQTFQLLSNTIPGGLMGGYIEDGFPLYYVNDKMLDYLGYTYDEFYEAIEGLVSNCMHHEDRKFVDRAVEESLKHSDEYEVTYRMLKKDGSYIWVFDHGRRIIAEDGRPAIISVCLDITEAVELQQALIEKNRELEHFYNTLFSGISKIADDESYSLVYANDSYFRMLGFSESEYGDLFSEDPLNVFHPTDRAQLDRALTDASLNGMAFSVKLRMCKKNGGYLWVRIDGSLSDETCGGCRIFYCIYTDIDEQREQEIALRKQEYFASLVLSSNTVGTAIVYNDEDYTFAYAGENLINFLGYTKAEFSIRFPGYIDICCPQDIAQIRSGIAAQLSEGSYYEIEYRVRKKDGSLIWVLEKGSRTLDEDGRTILVCVLIDFSQQKTARDKLLLESRLDPLTRVCNRTAARKEIGEYLRQGTAEYKGALFLLDLDNFKKVNDIYGHIEGDAVLVEVANILSNNFRNTDIVARLGGDEFIGFMKDVQSESAVRSKAETIRMQLQRKFQKHFKEADLTVSIGIAGAHCGNATFEKLYKTADVALYRAKCKGKNTFEVICCDENPSDDACAISDDD